MVSTGSQCALCVVLYLYTILSIKVMAMAEIRKQVDDILPHDFCFSERLAALMNVCSKGIDKMLMMDIDSLTFK